MTTTKSNRLRRALAALFVVSTMMASVQLGTTSQAFAETPQKRAVPDYDGRGPEPTTVGEDMLWIPRVVLSPVYFVTEYILRRPIMFLVTEAERAGLLDPDVFTFGDGNIGVVPTVLLDFGLQVGMLPSAGIYFWWDNFIAKGNHLRFRAAFGGDDWIELDLKDVVEFGADNQYEVYLKGEYNRRRDQVFAGIGAKGGPVGRYGLDELRATVGFDWTISGRSFLRLDLSLNNSDFFRGGCCNQPSVTSLIDAGSLDGFPPGYDAEGVWAFESHLVAAWDTRKRRPQDESGFRAEIRGGLSANLREGKSGWGHYGATLGGYVDIWEARTLGLILQVDFADPLGSTPVPFTDLVMLGGDDLMSGFVEGRLRGRSTVVLSLDYRWPIWFLLDGWIHAAVGNVFGAHLEDFELGKLRASFGFGVRPSSDEDHPFSLMIAAGTEPFEDGAAITNVRFVVGTSSGF